MAGTLEKGTTWRLVLGYLKQGNRGISTLIARVFLILLGVSLFLVLSNSTQPAVANSAGLVNPGNWTFTISWGEKVTRSGYGRLTDENGDGLHQGILSIGAPWLSLDSRGFQPRRPYYYTGSYNASGPYFDIWIDGSQLTPGNTYRGPVSLLSEVTSGGSFGIRISITSFIEVFVDYRRIEDLALHFEQGDSGRIALGWTPPEIQEPFELLIVRHPFKAVTLETWREGTVLARLTSTATSFVDENGLRDKNASYGLIGLNQRGEVVLYSNSSASDTASLSQVPWSRVGGQWLVQAYYSPMMVLDRNRHYAWYPYSLQNSMVFFDFQTNSFGVIPCASHAMGSMTFATQQDLLYLFDGSSTWSYDPKTNTWADLSPLSSPPCSGQMTYDPTSERVLFLAWPGNGATSQTWAYTPSTNSWANLSPGNSPISSSAYAPSTLDWNYQDNKAYAYIGQNVWRYDPQMNQWEELPNHSGRLPPGGSGSSFSYNEQEGLFFFINNSCLSGPSPNHWNIWLFDPISGEWIGTIAAESFPGIVGPSLLCADNGKVLCSVPNSGPRTDRQWLVSSLFPAPHLQQPSDGLVLTGLAPTFSWQPVPGAVSYTLRYAVSPSLQNATEVPGITDCTWTPPLPLADATDYYWQIAAFTADGTQTSAIQRFGIDTANMPPEIPSLSSPTDGATTNTVPDLSWQEEAHPGQSLCCWVELSDDESFTSLLATSPTLSAPAWLMSETITLPAGIPIWWRVQVRNSFGATATSSPWSFTILPHESPASFSLLQPAGNSTREDCYEASRQPTLSWEPSSTPSGTLHYLLRISTFPTLNEVVPIVVTATSYAIPAPLLDHATYFWDVWAQDDLGKTTKSSGQQYIFYTNAANEAPNVPATPTPADGGTVSEQKPLFTWTATDPDPFDWVFYNLYGSFDPTFSTTPFYYRCDRSQFTWEDYYAPGSNLYWKVQAYDLRDGPMGGESWSPVWSFINSVAPITALPFPYQSDLESDPGGWSSWGHSSDWQWGSPLSVGPSATHSGTQCWGTNLRGNYRDQADGYLLARFTGTSSPCILSYWQWFAMEANYDFGFLEASPDAMNWVAITSPITGTSSGWERSIVDLSPFLQPGSDLYLRFRLNSDQLVNGAGWYLDDISMMPGAVGSVSLTPSTATIVVGEQCHIMAKVLDLQQSPIEGALVAFRASGTHTASGTALTDQTGTATWSYTVAATGEDNVVGYAGGCTSDPVTNEWVLGGYSQVRLTPEHSQGRVGTEHSVTARLYDQFGNPISRGEIPVTFTVTGAHNRTGMALTDLTGTAAWSYIEVTPGEDSIVANTEITSSPTVTRQWFLEAIWTNLNPANSPGGRFAYSMSYDEENSRAVLFGGAWGRNDTWSYSPSTNAWSQIQTPIAPSARYNSAMAYDSVHQQMILFGGPYTPTDTWSFNCITNNWQQVLTSTAPESREAPVMAYDPQAEKMILFGGRTSVPGSWLAQNDTWAFDLQTNQWIKLSPSGQLPPARHSHGMVYDSQLQKILLFGGSTDLALCNDIWTYDSQTNTWEELHPNSPIPQPRCGFGMSYDSVHQRVAVFGGEAQPGDTWVFDSQTSQWTQLFPENSPSPRGTAMVFDPMTKRSLLFSGYGGGDDTWSLDLGAVAPLQLLSPNDGESWPISSIQTITWTPTKLEGNLAVELSRDSGNTWTETIASSVSAATGSFTWTVTTPFSTYCRVRVQSIGNPEISDQSNGDFSIIPPGSLTGSFSQQGATTSCTATFLVSFYETGGTSLLFSRIVTIPAQAGSFNLVGIMAGAYDIKIKESRALSTLKTGVVLGTGTVTVNFGELRVGDANNDDVINIVDFAILKGAIFTWEGQPDFDPRPDFNGEGVVNIMDFALMKSNFGRWGPLGT